MKIKTLIIDDELPARRIISHFIEKDERFELIGQAENGFDGLKMIKDLKPDLIFLDVQMPKLSGFELLELLEEPVLVVFSTAFNEYAVDAFNKNAIDYLLKPYNQERFTEALDKVYDKIDNGQKTEAKLSETQEVTGKLFQGFMEQIVFKNQGNIIIKRIEEVQYISSYDDYVKVHCEDKTYLKQKTMKFFEEALSPQGFIRVHRSFLVNNRYVKSLHLMAKDSYELKLSTEEKLKVSKSGYKKLKEALDL